MKRWQTIAIGVVISMIALFLAYRQADPVAIMGALRSANMVFIALGFLTILINTFLRGVRWTILTEGKLSLWDAFWLFNVGFMFNNVLPARLGEVARSVLAGRRPNFHVTAALSSVVVERLFDMVALAGTAGVILFLVDLPPIIQAAGLAMGVGATAGIIILAIAARSPDWLLNMAEIALGIIPKLDTAKFIEFLRPFVEGLAGVSSWRVFGLSLLVSFVSWFASGFSTWVFFLAFVPSAPLVDGFLAMVGAGFGVAIPAAPSGLGPFHAAVVAVLTEVDYSIEIAQSFAFVLHAANFIGTTLLGIIGLMREGVSFGEVARAAQNVRESDTIQTVESHTTSA